MRRLLRTAATAAVALLLTTGAVTSATASPSDRSDFLVSAPGAKHRPAADIAAEVRSAGGQVGEVMSHVRVVVAKLSPAAAAALSARPGFLVEAPATAQLVDTQSNPPSYGLDRVDQRALPLSASYSYPSTQAGAGVKAYVIDTGVLLGHEQFTGRITSGYNATTDGSDASDCAKQGHGTHVAGTVGGTTVGIARAVTIVPVRVFVCSSSSASWTDIIRGIDWVMGQHPTGAPAVANMSIGGGAYATGDNAVQSLIDDGVAVAVAAGNGNTDACSTSPARAPNALTVASSTVNDARAAYSNFGTCVDVFAPGGDSSRYIYSSYATGPTAYAWMAGTSMASPHVAGAAARYLTAHPAASPAQVAQALLGSATLDRVSSAGTGTPNRLLYLDPAGFGGAVGSVPGTPAALAVSAGIGSLTYSWEPPTSDGGSAVTGYTVVVRDAGGAIVSTDSYSASTRSATKTGLTAGSQYTVSVSAQNANGSSAAAVSPPTTVYGTASAPRTVKVTYPASLRSVVSWNAPSTLGYAPLVRYEVRWTSTSSTATYGAWVSAGTSQSYTITGIPKGSTRYLQVRAVTTAGVGTATSHIKFTPRA